MQPIRVLSILVATPATLASLTARATDPEDPYRPMDAAQESAYEDALELDQGDSGGKAWLSVGSFLRQSAAGSSDVGVIFMLGLPLERVAGGRRRRVQPAEAMAEQPAPPAPTAPTSTPAVPTHEVGVLRVTSKIARACVLAAWRAHGWGGDHDLDRMSARSRWSSALPEVRLRAARGWDESFRLTPTDSDPYRSQAVNGTSRWLEGRLHWRLDRVMFSDDEIPIERLKVQRIEARARLAGKVVSTLFDWQKASLAASDSTLSQQEHLNALLQQGEAEAVLDVLTAGWFSRWLRMSEAQ